MLLTVFCTVVTALLLHHLLQFYTVLKLTRGSPGFTTLFSPFSFLPSALLPQSLHFNLQRLSLWRTKADLYLRHNSSILIVTSWFSPKVTVLVADPEALQVINTDKRLFEKPASINNRVLDRWGPNILTSDGSLWRKHRKVVAPAFSERNNESVWHETLRVCSLFFKQVEDDADDKGVSIVKGVEEAMSVVTMMVISKAGFGFELKWPNEDEEENSGADDDVSFYRATRLVLAHFIPLTLLPNWVFELPNKNLRLMKRGSDVFDASIKRFIDERQRSGAINDDRHDLLALLLAANESEKGEAVLNDAELFSDVCIFLLAGHETSANTLSCLLVLLALYPEHQHAVHAEAVSVFSTLSTLNSTSYASTFPRLPIALATLQEGMRLAGPVLMMSKVAIADTVLPARTNEGERTQVFVPKGAIIREHVAGMHYHSAVWTDPDEFRPSRFLEEHDAHGWLPFSSGLRGCIGRNFALVESVLVLALTLLNYELRIPAHRKKEWSLREGETERERRERVLKPSFIVTLGPRDLDLEFVKRKKV